MDSLILARSWTDAGIVSASVLLGLLIILAFLSREKRNRRIRIGFFIERTRFEDEVPPPQHEPWKPEPGAEDETIVRWPGEEKT